MATDPTVDFVIVTAVPVERDAVLKVMHGLSGKNKYSKSFKDETVYYIGRIGRYRCALVMCHMGGSGRDGSTLATNTAIRHWNPRGGVIMPGIAFGRQAPDLSSRTPPKQVIGDVLVATQLHPYEAQRVGKEENISRAPRPESGLIFLNRLKNLDWKWQHLTGSRPLIFGPLLSGDKLVDNREFRDLLFRQFPDAIGGEMEGWGVYAAAQRARIDWIVIKAICDWADGDKAKSEQPLAAKHASEVLLQLLSEPGLVLQPPLATKAAKTTKKKEPRISQTTGVTSAPRSPTQGVSTSSQVHLPAKVTASPQPTQIRRSANVTSGPQLAVLAPLSAKLTPLDTMRILAETSGGEEKTVAEILHLKAAERWHKPNEELRWPSGVRAAYGDGTWQYPSSILAIAKDGRLQYPSTITARSANGSWQYPSVITAIWQDGRWQSPQGFLKTVAELVADMLRVNPALSPRINALMNRPPEEFNLCFLALVWVTLGPKR